MRTRIPAFFRRLLEGPDGAPLSPGARFALLSSGAAFALVLLCELLPHGAPVMVAVDEQTWMPAYSESNRLQFLGLLALCGAGLVSLVRRRRGAMELVAWAALLSVCWIKPVRQHPPPELSVHLPAALAILCAVAGLVGLVAYRRTLFPPATPAHWSRDLLGGARVTVAIFIAAEFWAAFVIRTRHPALLAVTNAEAPPPPPLLHVEPGRRTFLTLASSGGNVERETNTPFSAVLEQRLGERYNFLYSRMGGLNSAKLVAMTEEVLRSPDRPDAFIFYEGFQDYNYSSGIAVLRALDEPHGRAARIMQAGVRKSSLATYLLFRFRKDDCMNTGRNCRDVQIERILEGFARNLEKIIGAAKERGIHVFVVTLAMDESRVLPDGIHYIEMLNAWERKLPARFDNVTVVDFNQRVAERYPNRDVSKCEPYELGLTPGTCGNQYHLSRVGHVLLADTLAPYLDAWALR